MIILLCMMSNRSIDFETIELDYSGCKSVGGYSIGHSDYHLLDFQIVDLQGS